MDLANAVGADRITVGRYKIPRLTMRELATLTETIRDERRAALLQSLDDCGLEGFDKLSELQKLDHNPVGSLDGARWCRTPLGCAATIEAALAKDASLPQTVDGLGLHGEAATLLGYELWGLTVDRTPSGNSGSEGETEGDGPFPMSTNPTTPTGA